MLAEEAAEVGRPLQLNQSLSRCDWPFKSTDLAEIASWAVLSRPAWSNGMLDFCRRNKPVGGWGGGQTKRLVQPFRKVTKSLQMQLKLIKHKLCSYLCHDCRDDYFEAEAVWEIRLLTCDFSWSLIDPVWLFVPAIYLNPWKRIITFTDRLQKVRMLLQT